MRLRAIVTILVCAFAVITAARPASATPILTTNPADLAGATLIDFEDITTAQITNQYAPLGISFSPGLHADVGFPPLVPGGEWGVIAASNGDPSCCPAITMSSSNPLKRLGFEMISLDAAVTTLDIYTVLGGVSSFVGQVVLDTSLEIKFFGILANPADANPHFDSVVITTLLGPNNLSAFVMDNVEFEAVPEPASLTLLGTGAVALLARRRARRNAATHSA
jgi:hypothetical protein